MIKKIAIIGAGMAGISAARTLLKAGYSVSVFEKSKGAGGRMATRDSPWGNFDHGVQYFTVRDPRFAKAIAEVPGTPQICRPWSANAVRVLDELGHLIEAPLASREMHYVAVPGMNALVRHWAKPLEAIERIHYNTQIVSVESSIQAPDSQHPTHAKHLASKLKWTLHSVQGDKTKTFKNFDAVLFAVPSPQCNALLEHSILKKHIDTSLLSSIQAIKHQLDVVATEPCWTLMVAYPQASQPGLAHLGPQWNAAKSTHHRIAWVARESSKPGKGHVERWTVQAGPAWSSEHLNDDPERVKAKLLKAFAELTSIRVEPSHSAVHRWRYAKTLTPLGQNCLWTQESQLGTCGDWHIGHRVEDAFISGLSLALRVHEL